jgi:ubiquinone/menaquinone biosynthesis C-methylase UbiE
LHDSINSCTCDSLLLVGLVISIRQGLRKNFMSNSEESVESALSQLKIAPPTQKLVPVDSSETMDPANLSRDFVFDVYDKIAPHFSHTRYKKWPKVADFIAQLPEGSFLMDAGCGNGKNLLSVKNVIGFGSDRSFPFCEIARTKTGCESIQSDIARDMGKAFRESIFDAVIAIAVIHHIPTIEGRISALLEIHRLLKHGGTALVYVWYVYLSKLASTFLKGYGAEKRDHWGEVF